MNDILTSRERMLLALDGKETDRVAVGGLTTYTTTELMEEMGAYFPDVHHDARKFATLMAGGVTRYGFDCVRTQFCVTVVGEIFGCDMAWGNPRRTPMVKSNPYDAESVYDLEVPDNMEKLGRIPIILEAIDLLKNQFGDEVAYIGGPMAPFTVSGQLVGTENLVLWTLTEPDAAHQVLKNVAEAVKQYNTILEAAGCDVSQLSDPSSTADILSPKIFDDFSAPYITECWKDVRTMKKVLHICGDTTLILNNMLKIGSEALSIEEKVDPFEAVKIVNGRAALVGNVGIIYPMLDGTPEEVAQDTQRCIDAGFNVINTGCGAAQGIPSASYDAMVRVVKSEANRVAGWSQGLANARESTPSQVE